MSAETRSPIALCLSGGGFPGAFYEFGAVAALEAALPGWTAARSRVIVGTSCGAVAGAMLALGVDPAEALRALCEKGHPLAPRVKELSRLPWRRHARGIGRAVRALPRLVRGGGGDRRNDFADVVYDLQALLPGGLFSNVGIGALIERAASLHGRADRFDALLAPLLITASDLDSGERAVYGPGHDATAPLSLAVRASASIPMYFEPVRIGTRHLIDGQIVDPAHMDLAAIDGTRAILVVSPLVPYRAKDAAQAMEDASSPAAGVADLGVAAIMDQMARISASVKHRATRERVRREHPEIAVYEFRPEPSEALDLMRAGFRAESLINTWKLGFAGAARTLRRDAAALTTSLEPLGCHRRSPRARRGRDAVRHRARTLVRSRYRFLGVPVGAGGTFSSPLPPLSALGGASYPFVSSSSSMSTSIGDSR